jgi:hypothetical protein
MIDIKDEGVSTLTITITKDPDGRKWTVTDNITDVVGKGISREAALTCYDRGIEIRQMEAAGMDICDIVDEIVRRTLED